MPQPTRQLNVINVRPLFHRFPRWRPRPRSSPSHRALGYIRGDMSQHSSAEAKGKHGSDVEVDSHEFTSADRLKQKHQGGIKDNGFHCICENYLHKKNDFPECFSPTRRWHLQIILKLSHHHPKTCAEPAVVQFHLFYEEVYLSLLCWRAWTQNLRSVLSKLFHQFLFLWFCGKPVLWLLWRVLIQNIFVSIIRYTTSVWRPSGLRRAAAHRFQTEILV